MHAAVSSLEKPVTETSSSIDNTINITDPDEDNFAFESITEISDEVIYHAHTLPSSTPHWSNELIPHMKP
jgi:hypothetical protein